jgi:hypothetical protein
MCQLMRCGTRVSEAEIRSASRLPIAFKVRQRRAGSASERATMAWLALQMRLIAQQSAPPFIVPIKAAPFARNIPPESRALPQPWPWLERWSVGGCFSRCKSRNAYNLYIE